MAAPTGAAATSGGSLAAAAAGLFSAAPVCTASATLGLSMCQQPPSGPTGFAATLAEKWNSKKCGRLAFEAEAMELFERSPAYVFINTMPKRRVAATRWRSLLAGCSRPIRAAMETLARLGVLEPEAHDSLFRGLRMAMPILVRMARADPSPRLVKQVLALWVREAEMGFCLDEPTGAGLGADARGSPPAMCAGADDASSVFSEMPALESAVFNADMRASVRSAPLEARRVFHAAMLTALEQIRARPNDVDIRDALGFHAFLAAARRAYEAENADEIALFKWKPRGWRIAAAKAAIKAMLKAEEAFDMAAYHVGAALAARGDRVARPPAQGSGSALRGCDKREPVGMPDDLSKEAQLASMAAWVASGAGESHEPMEFEHHVPDDSSEEPDEMETVLDSIDGQRGAELTNGRNTCAPADPLLPQVCSLERMPRLRTLGECRATECCDCIARSLKITLEHCRAGNAVLVKLVEPENLYKLHNEREEPNISISHVIFNGSHIVLPDGVALRC